MTPRKRAPRARAGRRVPRPILALASPSTEHPVVTIEKLKGGELNWSIRVPGTSLPRAIDRAVAEAQRLEKAIEEWRRPGRIVADLVAASARQRTVEEGGP